LIAGPKKGKFVRERNYTVTAREWHVENRTAFPASRKGSYGTPTA
jgi:hypothetical protein